MRFLKNKRETKSDINYLELTPYRIYEHEFRDNGELVNILVPKFTGRILGKYLQPNLKYKYIKADLDKFGTATWLAIDGQTNVNGIAEKLVEQFGDEIQPVHQRLTNFLTQLYKAGFISFNELERN